MGEAITGVGLFADAKARALLEVVRQAFEGGIDIGIQDSEPCGFDMDQHPVEPSPPRQRGRAPGQCARVPGGPCMWCNVTSTPQWRRPRGTNKLLCNACGIYFTRYGRLPDRTQAQSHGATLSRTENATQHAAAAAALPREDSQEALAADHKAPLLPSTSQRVRSIADASLHKRKDAPQHEAELLRCLEDPPYCAESDSLRSAQPLSAFAQSAQLASDGGDASMGSAVGMAAAPLLTVMPLDLGVSMLGPCLTQQPEIASSAEPLLSSDLAQQQLMCLPPSQPQGLYPGSHESHSYGQVHQPLLHSMLSKDLKEPGWSLMGLQPGFLPSHRTLLDMQHSISDPQQQRLTVPLALPSHSLYMRPPKRRERLVTGESDDSNASTDSHAATVLHGDAGQLHDEEDSRSRSCPAASRMGFSPTAVTQMAAPTAFLPRMAPLPMLPGLPGLAGSDASADFLACSLEQHPEELVQLQQAQQPVILLQSRRSKGPRSRASSATPSTSTLS